MNHGFVKVAAITPKIKVAEPVYNAEVIMEELKRAYERKAKVIVFPELCLTGYTCEDLFLQERLLQEAREQIVRIAEFTKGQDALVFIGMPIEVRGKLYNVAAVLQKGDILACIPKTYIPNYGEFYEARHFASGREIEDVISIENMQGMEEQEIYFGTKILFSVDAVEGLMVACEICEDAWAPNPPGTSHALAGANVIVNLSASNETIGKDTYRKELVSATSARLLAGYVYASAGEGESTQDVVFGGHNLIAENGTVLAEAKTFQNQTIYGDIDIHRLRMERRRMNTYELENTEAYLVLPVSMHPEENSLDRTFDSMPFVPQDKKKREQRCETILSIQSYGLKKRYEHTGCKNAVIGISGGLDSTLALLVTVRAFDMLGIGRKNILAVTMPCFGTTDRTYDNACRLTRTLGATLSEIDIKEAVHLHFRDIDQDSKKHDVTYENGQARERTQILMDLANQINGLVIGTGDMSELALGFATYNGDHMSMYGVNAGVPKTLVRHLVQYYADTCDNDVLQQVLLNVLDTPVSPELLPPENGVIAQKTENIVGPYELHDFFLYYMLRCGFEPEKVYRIAKEAFQGQYDKETILKWLKLFYKRFFAQQFKRSCLPDGPKVGSVAVSPRGDLRMPSDACAGIWLQQIERM